MKEYTVEDCFFHIQNGANIKQGIVDGGYPITRIETISNDVFNRDRVGYAGIIDLGKYEAYVLEDMDLLMSHINSVQYLGRTVLYRKKENEIIIHGMNLLRLKARNEIINPAYARYYFYCQNFREQISRITKKSVNQASFAVNDLKKIRLRIPELHEQEEIVAVLDKVQKVIDMRKGELEEFDNLIKSRFVEMFGHDAPTVKLGDICQMINGDRGKNYPSGKDFVEEGIPFVNAGHLQNRQVDFDNMNYITEEKFRLLSQGKMQEGDILYCLRGSLGKHGLVNFERGAVASSLVILRCNQEKVLPKFLLYALETPEIELQLNSANNGSSQPNLSAASVKAYDIKVPTIEQQKQFVSVVNQVDKLKFLNNHYIKTIQIKGGNSFGN